MLNLNYSFRILYISHHPPNPALSPINTVPYSLHFNWCLSKSLHYFLNEGSELQSPGQIQIR